MRQVIVRFVFKGSNVIQAVVPEQEAKDWVSRYRLGHLQGRVGDAAGWFSFDVGELAGVQWCEIPPQPQQGQTQSTTPWAPHYRSGN